jgi:hypothetical protein
MAGGLHWGTIDQFVGRWGSQPLAATDNRLHLSLGAATQDQDQTRTSQAQRQRQPVAMRRCQWALSFLPLFGAAHRLPDADLHLDMASQHEQLNPGFGKG